MGTEETAKRRSFTKEFKAEVVRLCRADKRSTSQVAKELGLTDSAVREWVRRSVVGERRAQGGGLSSDETRELAQLRRENRVLREEREILKKAAAFFARESK